LINSSLKTVAISHITTLTDQIEASIVPERLIATLSGLFGLLASVLVAVGIYGLLAYMVARRMNEIGVRIALGASRGNVIRMVLLEASIITCGGIIAGVLIAGWTTRLVEIALGEASGAMISNGLSGFAMILIGGIAAFLPARRASLLDPMIALRYE
jgi:ABC-type antimicrobial peptide transport system permease subunit